MKKILSMLSIVFFFTLPMLAVAQPAATPATPAADTVVAAPAAATPAVADAVAAVPTVPPGPEIDPSVAVTGVIDAASSKQWVLLIGFVVMTLVFVLRRFVWKKLNSKWLPWAAIAIAVLGAGSIALVVDPAKWLEAILLGAEAGLVAAGEWGILGVVRKKKPA